MTHPTLRTPSFDDSQAKFKPKTFRQRVSNLSSLKIICLLIFFSLLLPFVAICLFMGTATVFKHQWAEKDHARGKLPPRPRPPAVPKAPAAPAALSTKSDGKTGDATTAATKTAAVAADPTNSGSSHFLIEKRNIAVHHCIDRRQRPKVSRDLTENTPITVPIRSVDEHAIYQLCFADDHPHQHTFKLKVQRAVGAGDVDCDLYLSASSPSPGKQNWDWKSNDKGADSIALHSYMEEFQAASLNALFIAVSWSDKALGKRPHAFVGDRCELTVEVATLPDEELLHKLGTLRGGQVLLPRDLDRLKKTGSDGKLPAV